MLTPEIIKKMPVGLIVAHMESSLRAKVPLEMQIELAMMHGAGDNGITSYEGLDMVSAQRVQKVIDYEYLAKLFNGQV